MTTASSRRRNGPAIPILPTADLSAAMSFYGSLGFACRSYDDGYAFVDRERIRLHLAQQSDYDPFVAASAVYVEVLDADAVYAEFVATGVLAEVSPLTHEALHQEVRRRWRAGESLARFGSAPCDQPWRMREFAMLDPSNNLLRVGHPID